MVSDEVTHIKSPTAFVVLILVLMEYGLWRVSVEYYLALASLNPCSNGIWSLTLKTITMVIRNNSLNPCSNGIWSLTILAGTRIVVSRSVLILVLMEYGLWRLRNIPVDYMSKGLNPCSNGIWSLTRLQPPKGWGDFGLNPCSNGIWSLTFWFLGYL